MYVLECVSEWCVTSARENRNLPVQKGGVVYSYIIKRERERERERQTERQRERHHKSLLSMICMEVAAITEKTIFLQIKKRTCGNGQ